MQLFSRRVQMAGPPSAVMAYATDMRAFVSEATGREIALWNGGFGGPVGTMFYAVRVEGIADLMSTMSVLQGNAEYEAKLAAGREYVAAPSEDSLGTPVVGELGDPPPVGSFATITTAQIANGMYAEALQWGVEIAEYAGSVTGIPTMFLTGAYGAFGTVTWIGVARDAAAVDAAMSALNGDAEYVKRLGDTKDLFVPGSGLQALLNRVA